MTAEQPRDPPCAKPSAWSYELATTLIQNGNGGRAYDGWEPRLTVDKPCVPSGSIRNLTPLYAARAEGSRPSGGGELLPCPFCGSDELSHGAQDMGTGDERGVVQCHSCDAAMLADWEDEAIAAWNRRSSIPAEASSDMLAQELRMIPDAGGDDPARVRDICDRAASFIEQRLSRPQATAVIADWMIANSYITGHGDTADQLLRELELGAQERQRLSRLDREAVARALARAFHVHVLGKPSAESTDEAEERWEHYGFAADAILSLGGSPVSEKD